MFKGYIQSEIFATNSRRGRTAVGPTPKATSALEMEDDDDEPTQRTAKRGRK